MNTQDRFSKDWFDPTTVQVTRNPGVPTHLTDLDYARISGAPRNSRLDVSFNGFTLAMDVHHPYVLSMRRELNFDIDVDRWYIYNSKLVVNPEVRSSGLGVRSVCTQILAAKELGMSKICGTAVGNYETSQAADPAERWIGYWVWPRLGFDALVPEHVRARLPWPYSDATYVSQLMLSPEGQLEWKRHGDEIGVAFDMTPGSSSWVLFNHYTAKRNIQV